MSNPIRTLAWGHFRNGRIPLSAMYIERGERFEPTAGHYLDELERAFAKVWGYPAIILEGYRSLARQKDFYAKWEAGTGDLAALPGTSNHGWGRAADFASHINVYGTPQKDWMNAHAPAYGWHPAGDDFTPREAWHFEYWSGTATASLTAKPILEEDEDMRIIYNTQNTNEDTRRALVTSLSFDQLTAAQSKLMRKLIVAPTVNVTNAEWKQLAQGVERRYKRLAYNLGTGPEPK